MDADYLLKNHSNDMVELERMVRTIIETPTGNDFIIFEIRDTEVIAEHRKYNGVRVNLIGFIKNTRTPFSIDFGIGDVVVPPPSKQTLPVLLSDFEKPGVLTYSLESIIAEKFDAIISHMELSSRMKDFFDIYYLASTCNFEGRKLQEALFETLQNRGTPFERDLLEQLEGLLNDKDMITRWNSFGRKILKLHLDLSEVLELIVRFIKPPFEAMLNEDECFEAWNAKMKAYVSLKRF